MVARIAPSPIASSVAVGDALVHASSAALSPSPQTQQHNNPAPNFDQREVAQTITPPPPANPPGEAFAAAVIAGQLPPRPMTPEQLRQRLGAAWQPPASPLRLMDRSA